MNEIITAVLTFLNSLVPNLLIFIALCLLDFGLGVAKAIKVKQFEWRRIGDFYLTNVIPFLLGWFLFASAGAFVIDKLKFLGEYQFIASTGFVWITWMFLVASLVGSIGANFKAIYGKEMTNVAQG